MLPLVLAVLAGAGCAVALTDEEDPQLDAILHAGPDAACAAETCNYRDDDCDGEVDEDFPDLGAPCDGPDADLCPEATYGCAPSGAAVACNDDSADTLETCNALDDDCDGMVDEGLRETYERTTGPVASSSEICCDAGDDLDMVVDCGQGANHDVLANDDCGLPYEGPGNGGYACATITCSEPCTPDSAPP